MWPADARAFSRPTSKAGEKRPGDEVEFSNNLEGKQQSEQNKRQRKSRRGGGEGENEPRLIPYCGDTLLLFAFLSNTLRKILIVKVVFC